MMHSRDVYSTERETDPLIVRTDELTSGGTLARFERGNSKRSQSDLSAMEMAVAKSFSPECTETRERAVSFNIINDFVLLNRGSSDSEYWGATPGLRKNWGKRQSDIGAAVVGPILRPSTVESNEPSSSPTSCFLPQLASCVDHFPGLLIAIILNLFLSMSFGNAFFTSTWDFPADIPRSIGVSMFLFSTLISQLVLTYKSDFNVAIGMMMVENIPFMHAIEDIAVAEQGMGRAAFATVMVAFALSSLLVGLVFFCLGYFKIGSAVYFIPRHCIIGCIGGIGIFIFRTGLEVSCNTALDSFTSLNVLFTSSTLFLWLLPLLLEVTLRLAVKLLSVPLLPPFFFCAIPPLFYLGLLLFRVPFQVAHDHGWFFEKSPPSDSYLIWSLFDFSLVDWLVIWKCVPTIIALCIFSLMHAPINIPSLTISTGHSVDMDKEMINHGYSNFISGAFGGLQNYMCYSNSLLYFKCGGRGKVSGYLLSMLTGVFFVIGPSVVEYVPRCMAGCLLLHVGIDLTKEAIYDTLHIFDFYEYSTIVIITLIMTAFGMTAGLAFCVICAAVTFTLQEGNFISPIRGSMSARTLRSSQWRSQASLDLILPNLQHVTVFQLQGTLFFGNASSISQQVDEYLQKSDGAVWFVILDFTLVVSIDSSAADTLSKLVEICKRRDVNLCYCRGSKAGFPTFFPLTEAIENTGETKQKTTMDAFSVAICDTMDESIRWCEGVIERRVNPEGVHSENDVVSIHNRHKHLWQLYCLCPDGDISALMTYFSTIHASEGTVLWRQGDVSDRAVLIVEGELTSSLEDEAGTTEVLQPGFLIGEYGLIFGSRRLTSIIASKESTLLELTSASYQTMKSEQPLLAVLLSKICIGYLGRRVQHVSNRVWESRCIPT